VRRNLNMMAVYYHTNFEIFTQNSTRQDRGTRVYADKYIYQYLKAGHLLKDKELLGMARARSSTTAFPRAAPSRSA
jgi:negative regulator of replication initiation